MVETVLPTLHELRKNYKTHQTRKYEWRYNQLQAFERGFAEMKREFDEAVLADLGRCANATFGEYQMVKMAVEYDMRHLKTYMADISEETELLLAPATTKTRYEPLGVCAIYSAWNYPIMGALKPLVQCITTGNAAIVKPSEIAPETSKVIKKFIDRCLDNQFYRCIEGGVDVAVELNKAPLDLICFTGSTQVGKIVAQAAAKNLTKCILELGGKCPGIIHPSANISFAADKVAWAKFSNAG
jgi:aldehyde dehydrogenase (NAD+)